MSPLIHLFDARPDAYVAVEWDGAVLTEIVYANTGTVAYVFTLKWRGDRLLTGTLPPGTAETHVAIPPGQRPSCVAFTGGTPPKTEGFISQVNLIEVGSR